MNDVSHDLIAVSLTGKAEFRLRACMLHTHFAEWTGIQCAIIVQQQVGASATAGNCCAVAGREQHRRPLCIGFIYIELHAQFPMVLHFRLPQFHMLILPVAHCPWFQYVHHGHLPVARQFDQLEKTI